MIIFKIYTPPWADADPVGSQLFDNLEALLEDPYIMEWNKGQPGFGYYQSRGAHTSLLMCMWDSPGSEDGKTWLVIGHVFNSNNIGLPDWELHKKKAGG